MKNFFHKTIIIILFFISIYGQDISVDAPKIILKNIPFKISFTGEMLNNDSIFLFVNDTAFTPNKVSEKTILFNKITISHLDGPINLYDGDKIVHQFERKIISGWVSILPPIIAIVLAFIYRAVVPALFAAIWYGAWAVSGFGVFTLIPSLLNTFNYYIVNTIIDRDHAIIILFTFMLGGMVGIVYRNGGMHGIIKHMIRKANTPKKGQFAIWVFGIIVFFDDYSNTLIVGNTSRLLCDKLKISRQKLAYLVDSTSAPVATIAVITTWVGFQIGIISDSLKNIPEITETPYLLFLHSIPYSFYPFLAITLVGLVVITGKDFGPMLIAEKTARSIKTVNTDQKSNSFEGSDLFLKDGVVQKARNAIIPILVLIASMLYFIFTSGEGETLKDILGSSDTFSALMHATLLSALTAAALSVGQGILTINETLDAWFSGLKFMLMGFLVLVLAWALADISKDLNTANYVVSTLGNSIPLELLPAAVFIVSAILAFGSGSSWGVMAILMPLVIPLTWAVMNHSEGENIENMHIMYSTIACVLTGSVWADHCSPISDTTILTSMATGCELMDHVKTQMPYAISAGLAALFLGTLPAGFGAPWWLLLCLGVISQVLIINYFGKKSSD